MKNIWVKINFRKEKFELVIIGLFLFAVLWGIKEFSENIWQDLKSNTTPSQQSLETLSIYGGYEDAQKIIEKNINKKVLPENRVVAYYGNLLSKKMGVLGEYPEAEMLKMLMNEVDKWNIADLETKAIPALHYIATVAQTSPGIDGKYRARMPDKEIAKILEMASKINALVFLDIQIGGSDLKSEVTRLKKYLQIGNVHLGIDPEFAMKNGAQPGTIVGTLDASEINIAINYLSEIVREMNLPPKILVVHRFTEGMITNYRDISPTPEVQVVINMDGFGVQALKKNTYKQYVAKHPIEYTGFKIFYKNDLWTPGSRLMQPEDLLKLNPVPVYIQYQ